MQPILIDRGQFVPQPLVEIVDDTGLASHNFAPAIIIPGQAGQL
jgi:hypothetical protein